MCSNSDGHGNYSTNLFLATAIIFSYLSKWVGMRKLSKEKEMNRQEFLAEWGKGRGDFSGLDLSGIDLSHLDIKGVNFKGAR